MKETEMKVAKLCEMKEKLVSWACGALDMGKEVVQAEEMGEVVDMIKDLADAEKNCWKACYYKKIIEAMDEEGRMGYDNWRYASGRFAPSGHGHFSGYTPADMKEDHRIFNRMGYSGEQKGSISSGGRYGYSYDQYMASRRNFHESGNPQEKEKMDQHAKEHMAGAMMTMRDIWGDADPEMKKKMKTDLMALINEMS